MGPQQRFLWTLVVPVILSSGLLCGCRSGPLLPHYPPEVVARVEADFRAHLEALRQEGVPETLVDLAMWYPEPPPGENAAEVYERVFRAGINPAKLHFLKEAASMPHYRFPVDWETGLRRQARGLIEHRLEYGRGMRDAARLLYGEATTQARRGSGEEATAALVTAFGMLRHQANDPMLIGHLVRYACRALLMGALESVLRDVQLDGQQLVDIDQALWQAYLPDALPRAYFAEKVLTGAADPFAHVPAVCMSEAADLVSFRVAHTVLAIERYRLAEGHLPASLDELVPQYLDAVPDDPFVDGPIRYVRRTTGYAVHSVGTDGKPRRDIARVKGPGVDLIEEVAFIVDQ